VQALEEREGLGGEWEGIGALSVFYLFAIFLVPPAGNFPLNDDWSYALAVRHLLERGELSFLPWTSVSLLLQLLWGALACKLTGFSFETLRATTLVASWLGAIGCYRLLWLWIGESWITLLCTLLVAANPLYFSLSYTFMTDVPFLAALCWAAFFYARGLKEERSRDLFTASLFASASALIRPYGVLAAAAAAACAAFFARGFRQRLGRLAASAAAPAAVFVSYHLWLALGPGLPMGYRARLAGLSLLTVPYTAANYGFRTVEYLGFFLLPLAAAGFRPSSRRPWIEGAALFLLTLGAGILYLREGALMFYLTNVLYDLGAGAATLRDTLFLGLSVPWALGFPLRVVLTVLATLGGALVSAVLVRTLAREAGRERDPALIFLLLLSGLFLGFFLLLSRYFLDRHILVLLPPVAACVAADARCPRRSLLAAGAVVFSLFSLAATHDYLAWNTARWEALRELAARRRVSLQEIDGGFEFNGWHLAEKLGTVPSDEDVRPADPWERKSWWWVVDDRFVVAFRPLSGYRVYLTVPFKRLLPPGRGRIYVLERVEG